MDLPSSGFALGLLIIPILAFLIIIHELGHFWAARSVGVKVEEFGIGIPPRVKGWTRKGVIWSINAIPFGGFVRVKGEDGNDFEEGSMNTKSPAQRAFFLAAGSAMNFLAAIVISILIVAFQGIPNNDESLYIADVNPNSPAVTAGWLPGDRIVSVNGTEIESASQLKGLIDNSLGKPVTVVVARGDEEVTTTVMPREKLPLFEGATGIAMAEADASQVKITDIQPGSAAEQAGWQEGDKIVAVNGVEVEASAQVTAMLTAAAGSNVQVTIERDGKQIETTVAVAPQAIVLTGVGQGSPAGKALLYGGDEFVSVNGTPITDDLSLGLALVDSAGETVPVVVNREGREVTVNMDVPAEIADPKVDSIGGALNVIGVNARIKSPYEVIGTDAILSRAFQDVGISRVIPEGFNQFWEIVTGTVEGFQRMLTEGIDRDQLTGPVGMGQMTSELLSRSSLPPAYTLGIITVVISISLGVLNLIPFPALDGGRLLFVLIEVLRGGRKISPEKEGLVHLAGMAILLAMMLFVAFGDIDRLVNGRDLLP